MAVQSRVPRQSCDVADRANSAVDGYRRMTSASIGASAHDGQRSVSIDDSREWIRLISRSDRRWPQHGAPVCIRPLADQTGSQLRLCPRSRIAKCDADQTGRFALCLRIGRKVATSEISGYCAYRHLTVHLRQRIRFLRRTRTAQRGTLSRRLARREGERHARHTTGSEQQVSDTTDAVVGWRDIPSRENTEWRQRTGMTRDRSRRRRDRSAARAARRSRRRLSRASPQ